MEFIHEFVSVINRIDAVTLEHRLKAVATPEVHKNRESNSLHSLYFETEGSNTEDYILCYYNDGSDGIRLVKLNNQKDMSCSEYCEVTRKFVMDVLNGNFSDIVVDPMGKSGNELDPILQDFYWQVIGNGLHPKHILKFDRKMFTYSHGNVRIYIDSDRRVSFDVKNFLNPECTGTLIDEDKMIKVEWESYLPDIIKSAIDVIDCKLPSYTSYDKRTLYV